MILELIDEDGELPPESAQWQACFDLFAQTYDIPPEHSVITVILNDAGIREYNKTYFQKDSPTDVISVTIDDDINDEYIWGELYVSAETARREAEQRRHNRADELLLYIIHGLLHLAGFEDETPQQRQHMWEKQIDLLKRCGCNIEPLMEDSEA